MKKTTYVIIGLLLIMILAIVIGMPLAFNHAFSRFANVEIVNVDSVISYTGKIHTTAVDGYRSLNFSNYEGDTLYVNVIFDAQADSAAVIMDGLWYDGADIHPGVKNKDILIIENKQPLFDYTDADCVDRDGRPVRRHTFITADTAARLFATVILPASSNIRSIRTDGFSLRVYGTVPQGLNLKSSDLEFCGDYVKSENK